MSGTSIDSSFSYKSFPLNLLGLCRTLDKCDPAIHSKHPSFEISSKAIQKLTDCSPSTQ